MISIGSSSSNSSYSTADSNDSQQDIHQCPVTGHFSYVLDDYIVFPKILGEGQYGCVRECIHRTTRKTYACKSVDKSKLRSFGHLRREVYLLSEMNHRNVVKMVGCYEDGDYVHIVTEMYSGGELYDKVLENTTDSGCFSEQRAADIVKSLLEVVAYLHSNDIVHRDIKPENILLESDNNDEKSIKLIDFGLSRRHRKGEAPIRSTVGTSYYMSPELLKGRYDKSCDVWAVGIIAYVLLSGYPPFNGPTDDVIFDKIASGYFNFPIQEWSGKSYEAKDFIKCLLRRDVRKRFTTAQEALTHPWIVSLGSGKKKQLQQEGIVQRRRRRNRSQEIRYLSIP